MPLRRNIDKERFRYGTSKRGRKRHIFPKSFHMSLCVLAKLEKERDVSRMPVCKICIDEYPKVLSSAYIQMFVQP